jgi:hypothetical protein
MISHSGVLCQPPNSCTASTPQTSASPGAHLRLTLSIDFDRLQLRGHMPRHARARSILMFGSFFAYQQHLGHTASPDVEGDQAEAMGPVVMPVAPVPVLFSSSWCLFRSKF